MHKTEMAKIILKRSFKHHPDSLHQMFYFVRKLLRSRRNIIHVNLFISFVCRGVFTMVNFYITANQDGNLENDFKLGRNFTVDNTYINVVSNEISN